MVAGQEGKWEEEDKDTRAVPLGAPWRCLVQVPHRCDPWAAYFDKNLPDAPLVTYFGPQRSAVWPGLHDKSCMSHCDSSE